MVHITNTSNLDALCLIDNNESFIVAAHQTKIINDFTKIKITPCINHFHQESSKGSKLLKCLCIFDDPFHTIRDFHIIVETEYQKHSSTESDINISFCTLFADSDTNTYYDYFLIKSDDLILKSCQAKEGTKIIIEQFTKNQKKQNIWKKLWNFFIEPILFEIIGYSLIYWTFRNWFGDVPAIIIILAMVVLNLLAEFILSLTLRKDSNFKFIQNLQPDLIYNSIANFM